MERTVDNQFHQTLVNEKKNMLVKKKPQIKQKKKKKKEAIEIQVVDSGSGTRRLD